MSIPSPLQSAQESQGPVSGAVEKETVACIRHEVMHMVQHWMGPDWEVLGADTLFADDPDGHWAEVLEEPLRGRTARQIVLVMKKFGNPNLEIATCEY